MYIVFSYRSSHLQEQEQQHYSNVSRIVHPVLREVKGQVDQLKGLKVINQYCIEGSKVT